MFIENYKIVSELDSIAIEKAIGGYTHYTQYFTECRNILTVAESTSDPNLKSIVRAEKLSPKKIKEIEAIKGPKPNTPHILKDWTITLLETEIGTRIHYHTSLVLFIRYLLPKIENIEDVVYMNSDNKFNHIYLINLDVFIQTCLDNGFTVVYLEQVSTSQTKSKFTVSS